MVARNIFSATPAHIFFPIWYGGDGRKTILTVYNDIIVGSVEEDGLDITALNIGIEVHFQFVVEGQSNDVTHVM